MGNEILKIYEYGNPAYLKEYDYKVYYVATMAAGDILRNFWRANVKRYFNRSAPNYFSKGGTFKLITKKSSNKSVLSEALGYPILHTGTAIGQLPLRNVVKISDKGKPVDLIKLLMHGVGPHTGMHYNPGTGVMQQGGTWSGFPASYWLRWDSIFEGRCKEESTRMGFYLTSVNNRTKFGKYEGIDEVIAARSKGEIKSFNELILI